MFTAALYVSAAVMIAFGLILLFVGPVSRRRPKVRQDLWIARYMFVTALFSTAVLLIVGVLQLSMVVYYGAMVLFVIGYTLLRRRYHTRRAMRQA